jgi:hypothetical protein
MISKMHGRPKKGNRNGKQREEYSPLITESFLRSGQVQLSTLSLREFIAMALLAHHCKARRAGFLQTVVSESASDCFTLVIQGVILCKGSPLLWTMKTSSLPGTPGKETIRHVCLGVLRTDRYTPSSCVTVPMLGKKGETTSQQSDDVIFPSRHKVSFNTIVLPVFAQAV